MLLAQRGERLRDCAFGCALLGWVLNLRRRADPVSYWELFPNTLLHKERMRCN